MSTLSETLIRAAIVIIVLVVVGWGVLLLWNNYLKPYFQGIPEFEYAAQEYEGPDSTVSVDSIQYSSSTCPGKIFERAKQYLGIDVTRDGNPKSACARFVSKVLYDVGFPIKVGSFDYVPNIEDKLLKEGSQKISKNSLQPGDIVVGRGSGASGRHVFIFTHFEGTYVCGIGEPGMSKPVKHQCNPSFYAGYRITKCK